MHLVRLTLTGQAAPEQSRAEVVHDALWAHLTPGHGVEHITATATAIGLELAVFVEHGIDSPEEYSAALIDSALEKVPALQGWSRCTPATALDVEGGTPGPDRIPSGMQALEAFLRKD